MENRGRGEFLINLLYCTLTILAEITCPSLEQPTNGLIVYSILSNNNVYELGTQAEYTCDAGFALVGIANRTCSAFDQMDTVGDWTLTAPTCQRKNI